MLAWPNLHRSRCVCLASAALDFFVVWHFSCTRKRSNAAHQGRELSAGAAPFAYAAAASRGSIRSTDIAGNEQANVFQMESNDLEELNQFGAGNGKRLRANSDSKKP